MNFHIERILWIVQNVLSAITHLRQLRMHLLNVRKHRYCDERLLSIQARYKNITPKFQIQKEICGTAHKSCIINMVNLLTMKKIYKNAEKGDIYHSNQIITVSAITI